LRFCVRILATVNRQTNKRTNRWTASTHKAALVIVSVVD